MPVCFVAAMRGGIDITLCKLVNGRRKVQMSINNHLKSLLTAIFMLGVASFCKGDPSSDSVLGYQIFKIGKGEASIKMPFTEVSGKCLTIKELLRQNAVRDGDAVCYYEVSGTNKHPLLVAVARKREDGFHFFNLDDGQIADNFVLLPSGKSCSLEIEYRRVVQEETEFTLSGAIPGLVYQTLAESSEEIESTNASSGVKLMDSSSLCSWISRKIGRKVYEESLGDVASKHGFSIDKFDEELLLKYARKYGPVLFDVYYNANEPRTIMYDPIRAQFVSVVSNRCRKIEINTHTVRRFEAISDDVTSKVISSSRNLPRDIVDEMNKLLNEGFFDDKKFFYIRRIIFGKQLVTYDKETSGVYAWPRTELNPKIDLSGIDILGFEIVPDDISIHEKGTRIGNYRRLNEAEVKELEEKLVPRHYIFWSWFFSTIGQLFFSFILRKSKPQINRWKGIVLAICQVFLIYYIYKKWFSKKDKDLNDVADEQQAVPDKGCDDRENSDTMS